MPGTRLLMWADLNTEWAAAVGGCPLLLSGGCPGWADVNTEWAAALGGYPLLLLSCGDPPAEWASALAGKVCSSGAPSMWSCRAAAEGLLSSEEDALSASWSAG